MMHLESHTYKGVVIRKRMDGYEATYKGHYLMANTWWGVEELIDKVQP